MHQRPGWLLSGEPLWHISQIYHSRAPLEACSALNVSTGVWLQTSVLLLSSRQQRAAAPRKILTKRSEANAQQSLVTALEVNCSDHFKLRHRCLALKMKNADYNVLTPSSRQLEYKCSLNVPQTERVFFLLLVKFQTDKSAEVCCECKPFFFEHLSFPYHIFHHKHLDICTSMVQFNLIRFF